MRFGKTFMASAFLAVMVIGASVCQGAAVEEGETWALKPVEKLGRGIANVAFGALEIPMKMWDVNQSMGGIAGITYGPLKGVAYTVAREVVGVVDIVTFLVPLPDCPDEAEGYGYGYGPIMRPAWVVDIKHNAFNFFYDEDSIVSESY